MMSPDGGQKKDKFQDLVNWAWYTGCLEHDFFLYTQKRADIVDKPSVFHLVISPAQGDITYGQGDITFTL